jgi:hypothetical protein
MAYASRHSSYILGSIGASIQVVAGWWDVYSHLLFGNVDPWWNPAHLTLYFGVGLVILAVWRGLHTTQTKPAFATPIRFSNTSGLKLAGFGVIIQIIAAVWNEIVHHLFLTEPKIAPAHALLTFGMLIIGFGMIIGLSIENGMIRHDILIVSKWKRWLTLACVILTFASIWLAVAGSLIYIARVLRGGTLTWPVGVLLAFVAALVLVPTKRVLPDFGSVTSTGAIFNCVAFVLLVEYAGAPAYVPWGLIPLALFDMLVLLASRVVAFERAVLFSSTVVGLLFYATYYPFTLYLFPWASSFGLPVMAIVVGGFIGSYLGDKIYSGLASFLLSGVT